MVEDSFPLFVVLLRVNPEFVGVKVLKVRIQYLGWYRMRFQEVADPTKVRYLVWLKLPKILLNGQ